MKSEGYIKIDQAVFVMFKRCPKCKLNKPQDEFNNNKSKPDGLQGICRECNAKYLRDTNEVLGYIVYQHVIQSTGEIFYIGSGRYRRAYLKTHRNDIWNSIVSENVYEVEILWIGLTKKRAVELELELQTIHNPRGCIKYGNIQTEETKMKISKANKGRTHTDESKKKMSQALIGIGNPRSKAVRNCRGQEFDSARRAATALNIDSSSLSKACRGVVSSTGKYEDGSKIHWEYL